MNALRARCKCAATFDRAGETAQIRIGTRGSTLARLQAQQVQTLLHKVRPEWTDECFELVSFSTHGDKETEQQLRALGQGAFTEVIDQAVAEGRVDIGVHSLKDQPVLLPQGVKLAACLPREDPRDAFISLKAQSLADLPQGARVGTGSLRRKAQLLHAHPHLKVLPVRGNIDSRLALLDEGELDAIILAAAGLSRLGQSHLITRVLDLDEMLPAACQGAIGVTCRTDDPCIGWELGLICHEPTRFEIAAERAMLAQLLAPGEESIGGNGDNGSIATSSSSCRPPSQLTSPASTVQGISSVTGLPLLPSFAIACHAGFDSHDGMLNIDGLVASDDGRMLHRVQLSGGAGDPEDAQNIGVQVGQQLRDFAMQHGWLS